MSVKWAESWDRRKGVPTYEPGDYIKAEFNDDRSGESEWMWVKVDYCDDSKRLVFGWLDNQSLVFPEKLKLSQRLAINYDNVRDHKKASEFLNRQME